ncbi:hypothetical protein P0082_09395 [Candidatus Haliotispira prima]|uniref:Lipoprotein n=1 Tax=Candidatus Haliotispira prima TaxID=3034016 RepID=A0ABY8MFB5_9SPIO|nr:hypothetical protein P0082_09395 [Candidatus Haliotispira prima]
MVLSGCAPLSQTGDPPATPSPAKSITVNYSGLHYVHFTVADPGLSADETVGFLITATDSSLSKAEAEVKKGYITRKFTEAKKTRDIFMFLHEGTAYELATGSTDIPFVDEATASDTSFETSDILQENTSYKIKVYDGDTILEKTFTTKSFSAGDVSSEGLIAYMGGLAGVSNVVGDPTDSEIVAIKASIPLKIERKAEEIMLIPYADDYYEGGSVDYFENGLLHGRCTPTCGAGISGVHVYGLRIELNKLASVLYIVSPQRKVSPSLWTVKEGIRPAFAYNTEIISE